MLLHRYRFEAFVPNSKLYVTLRLLGYVNSHKTIWVKTKFRRPTRFRSATDEIISKPCFIYI